MKKIILTLSILTSFLTFGQQVLTQSQEIETDNLYFGVSQTGFPFSNSNSISAKFAAWGYKCSI